MGRPIRKLLVANRGEVAIRIARTCAEMGVATVAVYSGPDARAPHAAACDEAVAIGGDTPDSSYLRADALVDAALRTGADAVHPGYGFLAENAGFARAVADAGLTWVGPPAEVIAAMGDKLEAKRVAERAGVPVLAGAEVGGDPGVAAAVVGFPLLVKAARGGGGRGMRIVVVEADLDAAVAAARREAASAFGDGRLLVEPYLRRPRHVEVQVFGDEHGNVIHLFERECSVQRRHQKVVEETPSPGITAGTRDAMCAAAVGLARAIGYRNAGTVEFVIDAQGRFWFLEMNTRLQVEHPVTELATGLDLVRLQLLVAAGEPLPLRQEEVESRGHAIEVRLYAEDPAAGYLPSAGRLHAFTAPPAHGVRVDAGVEAGTDVGVHYDPLLAKLAAHAPTRAEAAALLAHVLDRTVVHGVTTNRALLAAVLRDEDFLAGDTTTALLDERFPDGAPPDARRREATRAAAVAAVAAALFDHYHRRARARVLTTIPSGWRNHGDHVQEVTYELAGGEPVTVAYRIGRDGDWRVGGGDAEDGGVAEGSTRRARVVAVDERNIDLELDGRRWRALVSRAGNERHVTTPFGQVLLTERPRHPDRALAPVPGATLAPMPGAVVAVAVAAGQTVSRGDLLLTVEAMKVEHRVTAPHDGTVAEIRVRPGQQVDADEILVVVDPNPA